MSDTELDLPVVTSAEQIRRREFATVRRGYDPDQVRDYLEQIADQVGHLESSLRESRQVEPAHRGQAAPKPDPYGELATRVADLIRAADQQAEKLRREAAEEGERILSEARADADRIRLDAQVKAEEARTAGDKALREAKERADQAISGLSARRESLVEQLQAMQERLLAVARELETTIEKPKESAVSEDAEAETQGEEAPKGRAGDPFVDPRYEDLWGSTETVELNVPPLNVDIDDEDEEPGERTT
ncbi:MAG: DivIVA domain-containing protein [Actinobacteria bacterium]|nr:DivIVA domain-containing protein [Actinomycetota bacterium]